MSSRRNIYEYYNTFSTPSIRVLCPKECPFRYDYSVCTLCDGGCLDDINFPDECPLGSAILVIRGER